MLKNDDIFAELVVWEPGSLSLKVGCLNVVFSCNTHQSSSQTKKKKPCQPTPQRTLHNKIGALFALPALHPFATVLSLAARELRQAGGDCHQLHRGRLPRCVHRTVGAL